MAVSDRAFLQRPTVRGVAWRVRAALKQFLFTAMPTFLLICVVGALLQHIGVLERIAHWLAPLFRVIDLPASAGPGVVFSVVRKDGLLILNQDGGTLIRSLTAAQVFVLVYLGSTLAPCMVTLLAVAREFGVNWGIRLATQQAFTALASTVLLATLLRALSF